MPHKQAYLQDTCDSIFTHIYSDYLINKVDCDRSEEGRSD